VREQCAKPHLDHSRAGRERVLDLRTAAVVSRTCGEGCRCIERTAPCVHSVRDEFPVPARIRAAGGSVTVRATLEWPMSHSRGGRPNSTKELLAPECWDFGQWSTGRLGGIAVRWSPRRPSTLSATPHCAPDCTLQTAGRCRTSSRRLVVTTTHQPLASPGREASGSPSSALQPAGTPRALLRLQTHGSLSRSPVADRCPPTLPGECA
jgi:hypothetical protein